ncbi:MAG: TIGR01244 family phosphatase [Rhodospirillales bacterium]|nr:MAG: TIGR01244 family phosphatase [Rhodospirillales bacterium]
MERMRRLTPNVSVASQISEEDVARLAALGFRTIVNNRPDGETPNQPPGAAIRAAAARHGLAYVDVPVVSGQLTEDDVAAAQMVLARADGPVLMFCNSGTRSTALWALAEAHHLDPDTILATARDAGYDLGGLRAALAYRWQNGDGAHSRH